MTITTEILNAEYSSHMSMVRRVLVEIFHIPDAEQIVSTMDEYFRSLPSDGMFDVLHHDAYDMAVEWGGPTAIATDETFARYESLLDAGF